jgi:putative copper resistance protein D
VSLLIDLFGYLSIVLHGLTIGAQSTMLGGVLFLLFLARPLSPALGLSGTAVLAGTTRIAAWAAVALILFEGVAVALQTAVLVGTVDLSVIQVLGASFALAGMVKIAATAVIAILLFAGGPRVPLPTLLALMLVELAAATLTTHAAARLDDSSLLLLAEGLHQFGAAVWIGGIPSFLLALAQVHDGRAWRVVGARFSRMSMVGVGCILISGAAMSLFYIGDWAGFYGTAYGVMVGAKICMFLALLALGAGNFSLVERLRADPATPVTRLKRFAEVELGIGIAIFFAAASLTSVPPAVDLTQDRVTMQELIARNTPVVPRLVSPDHDTLALPALQEQLDKEAAAQRAAPPAAFVPGSGLLPPRNAADIAWSEYNHHWAGLCVLLIGLLALAHRAGIGWARHWPLLFLGLAVFLLFRSDPEVWPMGDIGFLDSLRDIEVLQHRAVLPLIVAFAFFEWRVRAQGWTRKGAAMVFPLICTLGGILLLTHTHAIANIKDQLLIEVSHTPLALAAIAAGGARWLELRLDPPGNRIAGWVWPACFLLIGLILLSYREA